MVGAFFDRPICRNWCVCTEHVPRSWKQKLLEGFCVCSGSHCKRRKLAFQVENFCRRFKWICVRTKLSQIGKKCIHGETVRSWRLRRVAVGFEGLCVMLRCCWLCCSLLPASLCLNNLTRLEKEISASVSHGNRRFRIRWPEPS